MIKFQLDQIIRLIAICLLFNALCACGKDENSNIGYINVVNTTYKNLTDIQIKQLDPSTNNQTTLHFIGSDYADTDFLRSGGQISFKVPTGRYYIFLKSESGAWFNSTSNTHIEVQNGEHWTVKFSDTGGRISKN